MPIVTQCPGGHSLQLDSRHLGQQVRCPVCQAVFTACDRSAPVRPNLEAQSTHQHEVLAERSQTRHDRAGHHQDGVDDSSQYEDSGRDNRRPRKSSKRRRGVAKRTGKLILNVSLWFMLVGACVQCFAEFLIMLGFVVISPGIIAFGLIVSFAAPPITLVGTLLSCIAPVGAGTRTIGIMSMVVKPVLFIMLVLASLKGIIGSATGFLILFYAIHLLDWMIWLLFLWQLANQIDDTFADEALALFFVRVAVEIGVGGLFFLAIVFAVIRLSELSWIVLLVATGLIAYFGYRYVIFMLSLKHQAS